MIARVLFCLVLLHIVACNSMPMQLTDRSRDPLLWIDNVAPERWLLSLKKHPRFRNERVAVLVLTPNLLAYDIAARLSPVLERAEAGFERASVSTRCPSVLLTVSVRAEVNREVSVDVVPTDPWGYPMPSLAALSWIGRVSIPDYRRAKAATETPVPSTSPCVEDQRIAGSFKNVDSLP